ncbi:MAG: hypothetical protein UW08_C0017G0006 [Parcubacteria group bacterium GW2011_GWB1_43_8b]|nr:MAG: hypothetical protein UW08_C0017G0006 [Parcubacteria group bacterium GW2011_GWB1_43_8b]KKT85639.1 MAG: hypothetical protein UW85_C0016G0004 [Parcubacteria group bacterium GW2011_GWA1_Parcubacteria_45_10]
MGLDDDSLSSEFNKNRNRYYQVIWNLEKDGLIEKSKNGKNVLVAITNKGRSLLKKIINDKHKLLSPDVYKNNLSKSDSVIIVAFDIPEKLRSRRSQIRKVLKSLDFRMIQKSVWIGKNKIPDDFIRDLKDLNLLVYIDIFSINKSGSLKSVL